MAPYIALGGVGWAFQMTGWVANTACGKGVVGAVAGSADLTQWAPGPCVTRVSQAVADQYLRVRKTRRHQMFPIQTYPGFRGPWQSVPRPGAGRKLRWCGGPWVARARFQGKGGFPPRDIAWARQSATPLAAPKHPGTSVTGFHNNPAVHFRYPLPLPSLALLKVALASAVMCQGAAPRTARREASPVRGHGGDARAPVAPPRRGGRDAAGQASPKAPRDWRTGHGACVRAAVSVSAGRRPPRCVPGRGAPHRPARGEPAVAPPRRGGRDAAGQASPKAPRDWRTGHGACVRAAVSVSAGRRPPRCVPGRGAPHRPARGEPAVAPPRRGGRDAAGQASPKAPRDWRTGHGTCVRAAVSVSAGRRPPRCVPGRGAPHRPARGEPAVAPPRRGGRDAAGQASPKAPRDWRTGHGACVRAAVSVSAGRRPPRCVPGRGAPHRPARGEPAVAPPRRGGRDAAGQASPKAPRDWRTGHGACVRAAVSVSAGRRPPRCVPGRGAPHRPARGEPAVAPPRRGGRDAAGQASPKAPRDWRTGHGACVRAAVSVSAGRRPPRCVPGRGAPHRPARGEPAVAPPRRGGRDAAGQASPKAPRDWRTGHGACVRAAVSVSAGRRPPRCVPGRGAPHRPARGEPAVAPPRRGGRDAAGQASPKAPRDWRTGHGACVRAAVSVSAGRRPPRCVPGRGAPHRPARGEPAVAPPRRGGRDAAGQASPKAPRDWRTGHGACVRAAVSVSAGRRPPRCVPGRGAPHRPARGEPAVAPPRRGGRDAAGQASPKAPRDWRTGHGACVRAAVSVSAGRRPPRVCQGAAPRTARREASPVRGHGGDARARARRTSAPRMRAVGVTAFN
ncbi:hypothetical protein CGC20_37065 [Leishmania donovani]|uniref:Uncharacterized protein n=1 Tax=Leishmania donovani TaxID=5661 RepID=A0A504X4C2_LEIDO|nr:hypothetical protein CGC20_37065 [Leishmania donovani]